MMIKRILLTLGTLSILGLSSITLTACASSLTAGGEDFYYPEDTFLVEAERSAADFEEQDFAGEAMSSEPTSKINSEIPQVDRIVTPRHQKPIDPIDQV